MRLRTRTGSLAILGLACLAGCSSPPMTFYTEPQALEAMRRNSAGAADNPENPTRNESPPATSVRRPSSASPGGSSP